MYQSLPTNGTPFQRWTDQIPDLSHICVFGSSVTVNKPGESCVKLDQFHNTTCFLLGYTATNRNIVDEDCLTQKIKPARHYIVDEAYLSSDNHPPYAKQLMEISEANIISKKVETKTATPSPALPNNLSTPPPTDSPHIIPQNATVMSHVNLSPAATSENVHVILPDDDPIVRSIIDPHAETLMDFELSRNPFEPSTDILLPVKGAVSGWRRVNMR